MRPVTAAGGVIYRRRDGICEVLLIYRKNAWDLPKGKKEEGETIGECARRELSEEVGIPLPGIEQFLTETYHEYERDGAEFGKTTHWFRMHSDVQEDFSPQKEEGIEAVRWMPVREAQQRVAYDNLKDVLGAFEESLK